MADHTISVQVNPLIYFGSEYRPTGLKLEDVSYASMMGFLCCPGTDSQLYALLARYNEISIEDNRLFAAPAEAALLERLIWPLRHAKGSYILGNYLGAIALCGLVAEMAAILTFDLHNEAEMPHRYDKDKQRNLFGSAFEKLGQERRVSVLKSLALIDAPTKSAFDAIRERRRRYLHLWSEGHEGLNQDAIKCFDASIDIVIATLGIKVDGGKLLMKDEVFTYLTKHGAASPGQSATDFGSVIDDLDATESYGNGI